jgi:hypothetical protein
VPPGGLWLLISPPSDAPSPRRLALALAAPAFFSSARGEATGRTRGQKIGTAILSYAEHGKFRAQTQGQPSLLPAPCRAGKESGSKLWLRPLLRLGLPQCPATASGPRQARKRNGQRPSMTPVWLVVPATKNPIMFGANVEWSAFRHPLSNSDLLQSR